MPKVNDFIFNFRNHSFCVNNKDEIEGDIRDSSISSGYIRILIPLRAITVIRVIDGDISIQTIHKEYSMQVPPCRGHDEEQQEFMKWIIEAARIYRDKIECLQPIGACE